MNQFYTSLVILCFGVSTLHAQVTLTQESHGLQAGDAHHSQKVAYKDPGASGSNIVWDFRDLSAVTEVKSSLVNDASDTHNISVLRDDKTNFFFNVTNQANEYKGYATEGMQVTFSDPIVKVRYPFSYGNQFSGEFNGMITYTSTPDNVNGIIGSYSSEADATGTILLPDNISLTVMRVKTVERYTQWACGNNPVEFVKYLWYAQDVRYPVFVTLESTYTYPEKTVTEKYSFHNVAIIRDPEVPEIPEEEENVQQAVEQDIAYKISPNPFKDELRINYTLPHRMTVNIDLYSMTGAKVATIVANQQQDGDHFITFNITKYAQIDGIYILKMQFGGKSYAEKLVLSN